MVLYSAVYDIGNAELVALILLLLFVCCCFFIHHFIVAVMCTRNTANNANAIFIIMCHRWFHWLKSQASIIYTSRAESFYNKHCRDRIRQNASWQNVSHCLKMERKRYVDLLGSMFVFLIQNSKMNAAQTNYWITSHNFVIKRLHFTYSCRWMWNPWRAHTCMIDFAVTFGACSSLTLQLSNNGIFMHFSCII